MEQGKIYTLDPLWAKVLFIFGYWILGSLVFSLATLLGLAQVIVMCVGGKRHEGLESSSGILAKYVRQCLSYIIFTSNTKPFPLGPVPEEDNL